MLFYSPPLTLIPVPTCVFPPLCLDAVNNAGGNDDDKRCTKDHKATNGFVVLPLCGQKRIKDKKVPYLQTKIAKYGVKIYQIFIPQD